MAELLTALAAEAPLVVIVDDLHDATARDRRRARRHAVAGSTGPVLVLLLGRPELVRTAGALTRLADAEVHPLPPLRGADAARLLTAYLGGGKLPQADADRLLATAQGNPFYLAELVTLLMERGALTAGRRAAAWRLAAAPARWAAGCSPGTSPPCSPPASTRCPPEARAVLRDAAVVGDTVPAGALEALREQRAGRRRPARPRWPRSSWNAPSTSCCNAACCTAPGAATRSPPR